jgi:hypothetical protein
VDRPSDPLNGRGDIPTNYQRGRAFEYRVRNKLKKNGAAYVMRAAQSKGIVDLLALWPLEESGVYGETRFRTRRHPWLVQAKYSVKGGGTISPADRAKLIALADATGAVPVTAMPGKNGRGIEFINLHTKGIIG